MWFKHSRIGKERISIHKKTNVSHSMEMILLETSNNNHNEVLFSYSYGPFSSINFKMKHILDHTFISIITYLFITTSALGYE